MLWWVYIWMQLQLIRTGVTDCPYRVNSVVHSSSEKFQKLKRCRDCALSIRETSYLNVVQFNWVQFSPLECSSVAQSSRTLCDAMNLSTPGLPVHHQLPEFTQTHVHGAGDVIQPSHPLSSPSPPAPNPSQHQSLFQWFTSSHAVAKLLEFQL